MPAIPTIHATFDAKANAEQKTRAQRGSGRDNDPQTEIIALCRQAESLAKLMETGADNNDPKNINIRDTALERVCAIAGELVHHPAAGPADILGKIRLWRMLAVEDTLDLKTGTPDERLLLSIIEDIERQLSVQ